MPRLAPVFGRPASTAPQERIDELLARHKELTDQFASGKVEPAAMAKLGRELNFVTEVSEAVQAAVRLRSEISDLEEIVAECKAGTGGQEEAEMRQMAEDDLEAASSALLAAENTLQELLAPRDEADARDAILEVRAGAGGEEAALFAAEMFQMYAAYAQNHSWGWEEIGVSTATAGGFKEASATVSGEGAFGRLKWERGTHRVQRIPATESGGRVHTSTVTVAVMPQADEVDVEIRASDIRMDTYRAQGAGGQHVNTTDSAVRLTHVPTGTVVTCQNERSQHQNKATAMKILRARIFETLRDAEAAEQAAERKAQIGTGERSERIRTYNWNQDRITDHRVSITKCVCSAPLLQRGCARHLLGFAHRSAVLPSPLSVAVVAGCGFLTLQAWNRRYAAGEAPGRVHGRACGGKSGRGHGSRRWWPTLVRNRVRVLMPTVTGTLMPLARPYETRTPSNRPSERPWQLRRPAEQQKRPGRRPRGPWHSK